MKGERVVVTGGTSGIGAATSRRFVADGASVAVISLAEEERVPGLAGAVQADVSDPAQVADAFAEIDDLLGGLDVLVANAGFSIRHPFLEITVEEWQRVLAVNLSGVFYCAQEAARRIESGSILMTASTNGIIGHPYYADYNAAKAGVIALAKSMALELAPRIRVNAVCPGYVLTPMQRAEYTAEMLEAVDRKIPLARHASPDEIAAVFAFLASDAAAYITGAAISVDGGETAGGLASRD
jgi:meso-butanediol dehydrogenase / (S,S)-butanediol dehydrogenase / diacetyl reductase